MEFLGVKKGINFIIVGEIMGVISSILFGFATLFLAISLTTINSGNADEQGVVFILSSVPGLISRITVILSSIVLGIGLIKALRDESKFKEALVILIISMLIFSSQFVLQSIQMEYFEIALGLADMWVMVAILQGMVSILDKMKNNDLAEKGIRAIKWSVALTSVSVISNLSYEFFVSNTSLVWAGVSITIVSAAAQIINYIIYISFLSKTKRLYFSK